MSLAELSSLSKKVASLQNHMKEMESIRKKSFIDIKTNIANLRKEEHEELIVLKGKVEQLRNNTANVALIQKHQGERLRELENNTAVIASAQDHAASPAGKDSSVKSWYLEGADGITYGRLVSINPQNANIIRGYSGTQAFVLGRRFVVFNEDASCFATFQTPPHAKNDGCLELEKLPVRFKNLRNSYGSSYHRTRNWLPAVRSVQPFVLNTYRLEFEDGNCESDPLIDWSREAVKSYRGGAGRSIEVLQDNCLADGPEIFKLSDYVPPTTHFHPKSFCYFRPYDERIKPRPTQRRRRRRYFMETPLPEPLPFARGLCEKCFKADTFHPYSVWKRFENVTGLFPGTMPRLPVKITGKGTTA